MNIIYEYAENTGQFRTGLCVRAISFTSSAYSPFITLFLVALFVLVDVDKRIRIASI